MTISSSALKYAWGSGGISTSLPRLWSSTVRSLCWFSRSMGSRERPERVSMVILAMRKTWSLSVTDRVRWTLSAAATNAGAASADVL